jgi:hypothetical protein
MVRTVRPKARATPKIPIPLSGIPAAKIALPQPPTTTQNVTKNSAKSFFIILFILKCISNLELKLRNRKNFFKNISN